jgi:hypothetical protein
MLKRRASDTRSTIRILRASDAIESREADDRSAASWPLLTQIERAA